MKVWQTFNTFLMYGSEPVIASSKYHHIKYLKVNLIIINNLKIKILGQSMIIIILEYTNATNKNTDKKR